MSIVKRLTRMRKRCDDADLGHVGAHGDIPTAHIRAIIARHLGGDHG